MGGIFRPALRKLEARLNPAGTYDSRQPYTPGSAVSPTNRQPSPSQYDSRYSYVPGSDPSMRPMPTSMGSVPQISLPNLYEGYMPQFTPGQINLPSYLAYTQLNVPTQFAPPRSPVAALTALPSRQYQETPQMTLQNFRTQFQSGGRTADGLDLPHNVAQLQPTPYGPRVQGAVLGRGTDTSDNIAAALSPNEFVFTAKAVRGAGDGNLRKGIASMYDLMRRLERRAGGSV